MWRVGLRSAITNAARFLNVEGLVLGTSFINAFHEAVKSIKKNYYWLTNIRQVHSTLFWIKIKVWAIPECTVTHVFTLNFPMWKSSSSVGQWTCNMIPHTWSLSLRTKRCLTSVLLTYFLLRSWLDKCLFSCLAAILNNQIEPFWLVRGFFCLLAVWWKSENPNTPSAVVWTKRGEAIKVQVFGQWREGEREWRWVLETLAGENKTFSFPLGLRLVTLAQPLRTTPLQWFKKMMTIVCTFIYWYMCHTTFFIHL